MADPFSPGDRLAAKEFRTLVPAAVRVFGGLCFNVMADDIETIVPLVHIEVSAAALQT